MQILSKLLRTLIKYNATLAVIPADQTVRIFVDNEWTTIKAHPILSAKTLDDLNTTLKPLLDFNGRTFFISLTENATGPSLTIELLKPLAPKNTWPNEVFNWISEGGYLEVHAEELYASILTYLAEKQNAVFVSLEKTIKYQIKSKTGLVHQKELGLHFLTLKEGLKEAEDLHATVTGIAGITLGVHEKTVLKNLSTFHRILVLSPLQHKK